MFKVYVILFAILLSFNTTIATELDRKIGEIVAETEKIENILNEDGIKKNNKNETKDLNTENKTDEKKEIIAKNGISTNELVFSENDIPLNLYNLIYIGLERNNTTKRAFINVKIAERELAKGKSVYYPSLSASAGYSRGDGDSRGNLDPKESFSASLDLNYEIFAFGRNRASVKALENYLLSTEYEKDNTVQSVIYSIAESYYNLLSSEAKKTAALEIELSSQEAYKAASLKYNVGLVPLADKLKAKSSYSSSKLDRIKSENEIKQNKATLNNLLNLEPEYVLYIENPEINIKGINNGFDYYLNEAKKNRFDLKSLEASKKEAIYNLKAAKAERYPSLNVKGSLTDSKDLTKNTVDDKNYVDNSISVGISIPLFTGFSTYNNIKVYEKRLEDLNIQIEQKNRDIEKEVWNAYNNFNTNQVSYFVAKDTLESAEETAKLTLGMYKNGKASILDVLTSQDDLATAKYNFISSKYNWLIYRMNLLKVIGKMNLENIINIDKL